MSLEPLTLLVGENNAGKSSVLQALATFFGHNRSTEDDLYVDDTGQRAGRFVIDVRFVPGAGLNFNADVQSRLLGKVQFPKDVSHPHFFTMRAIGAMAPDGSGIALERRFMRGWASDRRAAEVLPELLERPTREHLELVNFFLLDARRDLVEELRTRTSHWGRLLADLGLEPGARAEIEDALTKVGETIVGASPVLGSVKAGLNGVKEALGGSVGEVTISPVPGRVDEIARAVDVLIARPTGPALPLRLQGQGSRSLAAVMVFESFVQKRAKTSGVVPPLVVSAFEEPEAHLHPQAHRAMLDLIDSLQGQKIVSTHSPHVARVADIYCIRSLTRGGDGTPACKSIPRMTGGSPTFSPENLAKLKRFVIRNNGEVLFARAVVVVEGDAEDLALPVFAREHWGKDHGLLGVSIAHTGGARSGQHVVPMLEFLGIPWVLFADGDNAGSDGIADVERVLGRKLNPDEHEQLPTGACFEQYLVDVGYAPVLLEMISEECGATAVADYRKRRHGEDYGKGKGKRDYQGTGWEERLVRDFCLRLKGSIGLALASAIVTKASGANLPKVPPAIASAFAKIEKRL